mmetsp:Transcript_63553/g.94303  ORF Transcript_63553/g.94303 Transcript_63553/m.94303 type:complete len:103 (+) Transcript_63553:3608-3916(+)
MLLLRWLKIVVLFMSWLLFMKGQQYFTQSKVIPRRHAITMAKRMLCTFSGELKEKLMIFELIALSDLLFLFTLGDVSISCKLHNTQFLFKSLLLRGLILYLT